MAFKLQFVTVSTDDNSRQVLESLVLDAALAEMHDSDADVTEFPVEQGSDITDNIRLKPRGLQVEALISDFHLKSKNNTGGNVSGTIAPGWHSSGRLQDEVGAKTTLAKLEDYQSKGTLIDVETGLKSYRNMVIKSLHTPRDKRLFTGNEKTAGAIKVTIMLQSIIIVESQSVVIKQSIPKGQAVTPKGQKTATSADAGKENQSLAFKSKEVPEGLKKAANEAVAAAKAQLGF